MREVETQVDNFPTLISWVLGIVPSDTTLLKLLRKIIGEIEFSSEYT